MPDVADWEDTGRLISSAGMLLRSLAAIFYRFESLGWPVPASSALELQHVCMHFAALSLPDLPETDKCAQLSAAVSHCRRALLDACKVFIFEWKIQKGLAPAEQIRFSQCRTEELSLGFLREYERIISNYKALVDALPDLGNSEYIKGRPIPADSAYWENIRTWLELDLLYSSLSPDGMKDQAFLKMLLISFLHRDSPTGMTPGSYLALAVNMQKIAIIKLMLNPANASLLDLFKSSLAARDEVSLWNQKTAELQQGQLQTAEDYKKAGQLLFPMVGRFFRLKYA